MVSTHEKTYSGKYGDSEVRKGDGSLGASKYVVEKPSGDFEFFGTQKAAHERAERAAGK